MGQITPKEAKIRRKVAGVSGWAVALLTPFVIFGVLFSLVSTVFINTGVPFIRETVIPGLLTAGLVSLVVWWSFGDGIIDRVEWAIRPSEEIVSDSERESGQ